MLMDGVSWTGVESPSVCNTQARVLFHKICQANISVELWNDSVILEAVTRSLSKDV